MNPCQHRNSTYCPRRLGRRNFLAMAGASAAALNMGILEFASSLFGEETPSARKPRVRALFVRPDTEAYWMGWPGAAYNPEACQTEYTKTLAGAAKKLGVQLDVNPVPLNDPDSVSSALELLTQYPPDGLVVTVMDLHSWPQVQYLAKYRGDIPMIVFSPLGTSVTDRQQAARNIPKTFVAATQDCRWLATGMRMLKTVCQMKDCRLCMVTDVAAGDQPLSTVGTTLHYVPLARWAEEFRRSETTEEMQEIAKYHAIEAQDIVEPEKDDLFNAAKNYVVARQIMQAENCQGISLDCARSIGEHQIPCGPCLAWSRLLDEGCVGACEADADAAVSLLLAGLLLERPGFMQDPAPNTVNNTLIGSHCTCATKLDGYDQPHRPYVLRSHYESNTGVALQVFWEPGQEITIMKMQGPDTMLLGTGRVVGNAEAPFSGGCRTRVEIKVDDVADSRDVKGHHQLFICGKWDTPLKAYCELAGIKLAHI
jgi:hypothetical protein